MVTKSGKCLCTSEIEARSPGSQRTKSDLRFQKGLVQRQGLGELPGAEIGPPHFVPEGLFITLIHVVQARSACLPCLQRLRAGLRTMAGGCSLQVRGLPQLKTIQDKVIDRILALHQKLISIQDLGQDSRRKTQQSRLHVGVGHKRLKLFDDQIDSTITDLPESGTIIRAWNVKAAVLLQQERRRIGKGSLDPPAHRVEETVDAQDVCNFEKQQRL
mmetsp:Transcript_6125/g.14371  ORF Transcript_6125/g.14371 Transcript_6125/m.14371 type:complete len:216 (-) Transcript_6125:33-680(-)